MTQKSPNASVGESPVADFPDGEAADGNTPLTKDEAEGLIPDLQTRGELNAWEQANIVKAVGWATRDRRRDVLTIEFLGELHRRMLDETWIWAGQFRRSDKSIGVYWATIPGAIRDLLDDTKYWVEHATYSRDEILARFHYRLVSIHPFPNGNGRHGRLMTDVIARNMGWDPPTWGRASSSVGGRTRDLYLAALKQADQGNMAPLIAFVRA